MLLKDRFLETLVNWGQKDKFKEVNILTNNVGQPWNIAEEKDDHNPDENVSQVDLFLHRGSRSFVGQSEAN